MENENAKSNVIVVTGGAGYIGSQLIRDLAVENRLSNPTIRIYDNLQRHLLAGLMDLPSDGRYELIQGDILDRLNLERAIQGASAIIHLAALVTTPLSFDHPEWTEQINHLGTASVVKCALNAGVSRLIFVSSASVYGPGGPFKETDPCRPVGPYSTSKRKAEDEVLQGGERGLKATILRLGTTFGTAPAMRFDAVANRFAYLSGVKRPLIIHGSGNQVRPLIHVQDASAAIRLCLTDAQTQGEIINANTLNPTVNEIAQTLQAIVPEVRVHYTDQDLLNEVSFEVDASKLQRFGFSPKFDLRKGLDEIVKRWRGFYSPLEQTPSQAFLDDLA